MNLHKCLCLGGMALAWMTSYPAAGQDTGTFPPPVLLSLVPSTQTAAAAPSEPTQPPRGLLMGALDQLGIGLPLDDAGIRVYGHIEGGYTYNFNNPSKDINVFRFFDVKNNHPQIDQLDLNFERYLPVATTKWDVGGRIELLYGTDARLIHGSGFHDADGSGPEYQFDLTQAYLDVDVPLGSGVRLRGGKFLLFKNIDPNASVFYSHTFWWDLGLPNTMTGATAAYAISDGLTIEAGVARGWDQALTDSNGAATAIGQLGWDVTDKWNLGFAFATGPELADDNHTYVSAIELNQGYKATDNLNFYLDAMFGHKGTSFGQTGRFEGIPLGPFNEQAANWYGVAGYAVLKLDSHVSVGARAEWFRDEEGFLTGFFTAHVGKTDFFEEPSV